jgi:hypothetical protein
MIRFFGNYKGTTGITGTFGEVLEHNVIFNKHLKPTYFTLQSELQFSFTEELSPLVAALILAEATIVIWSFILAYGSKQQQETAISLKNGH